MIITKKRVCQLFILAAITTLPYCVTDDYNLKNGVNTDMTLGGDSLSVPLGMSDSIFLSDMIDDKKYDILKKGADGSYSISFIDSTKVNIEAIKPVTVSTNPTEISPITTKVADFNWPAFDIAPVSVESSFEINKIDFTGKTIQEIHEGFNLNYLKSNVKHLTKIKGNKTTYPVGPIVIEEPEQTFQQHLNFDYSQVKELRRIDQVYLKNDNADGQKNLVTLTLDRSSIMNLGFPVNDTIRNFYIHFPSSFELKNVYNDPAITIVGSSLYINKASLGQNNKYYAKFEISSVSFTPEEQGSKIIDITNDIRYGMTYSFYGEANDIGQIPNQISVNCKLDAAPEISDMKLQTNSIDIAVAEQNSEIAQTINNIPKEVSKISSVSFDNAALELNISNTNISPFEFGGDCQIQLPHKFIFAPNANIGSDNVLTLPYNQLSGIKTFKISGINIDATVVNDQIKILDSFGKMSDQLTLLPTSTNLNSIKSGTTKTIQILAKPVGLSVKDAAITTNQLTFDIPSVDSKMNIEKFVSTDLEKIYNISLAKSAKVNFNIKFNNIPTKFEDGLQFQNYEIKFPNYLRFKKDGKYTWSKTKPNTLILNDKFTSISKTGITLELDSFNFVDRVITLAGGVLKLDDPLYDVIQLQGQATVKGTDLSSVNFGSITIQPSFTVDDLQIAGLEGKITTKIEPVNEQIKLDLPNELKDPNNNLDIKNPIITLEVGNSLGIPVDVILNLIPKSKGVAIPNASVESPVLKINAAEELGKITPTKFRISKSLIPQTDDYQSVVIENLPNLLKTIPDSIIIKANSVITGDHHKVDLYSKMNQINLKYAVNVPLEFGENFKIQYNDTISDLHKDLEDILKLTRNIDITAAVDSKIPMNLSFKFCPLDSKNDSIKGIEFNSGPVNYTGIGEKQIVKLGVKETVAGALDKLDKVIIRVSGEKNNPALTMIPLRPDQYMIIELKVKLPNGITIKKDDF